MSDEANQKLMISAWRARNKIYEELFGAYVYSLPKAYAPPAAPEPGFSRQAGGSTQVSAGVSDELSGRRADEGSGEGSGEGSDAGSDEGSEQGEMVFNSAMRAQRISVLAYGPRIDRPYWTYVTAGLSNPWFQEEPGEVSGFGCELVVKSAVDARWPIRLLRPLAYYILSYTGTLSPGVILNMKAPIGATRDAHLNNIFVWYVDEAPDCLYELPSGAFGLFSVVGITEDECQFAESVQDYGTFCIQQVLRQSNVGQVTDPARPSVMQQKDIDSILKSVKTYVDNFRSTV